MELRWWPWCKILLLDGSSMQSVFVGCYSDMLFVRTLVTVML